MKWVLIVGEIVSKREAKLSPECGKMLWKYQRVSLEEIQTTGLFAVLLTGLLLINTLQRGRVCHPTSKSWITSGY